MRKLKIIGDFKVGRVDGSGVIVISQVDDTEIIFSEEEIKGIWKFTRQEIPE